LHRVKYEATHRAADDAIAAAHLLQFYLENARQQGVHTFADLMGLRSYKFFQSLVNDPFPCPALLAQVVGL
jgi:DNA polymerase III alpha subunit (gram-positive type)